MSGRVFAAIGPTAVLEIQNAVIAPSGFDRTATLANGGVPGPLISGSKGDTFSIDVQNLLDDDTLDLVTSIHWHGIFQKDTNYADGVAFVTQCPIIPGEAFTYVFPTINQTGTYWYHSHFQAQYCDGLRGPLVIYDPDDPHASLYDVDDDSTVITLADWYNYSSLAQPAIPTSNSTLINGIGRYAGGPSVSLATVNVVSGVRYRLRLVSISCDPNFTFSIDGHNLTIIEVDGVSTQPLVVDSLQIFAGQRYSAVLNADQDIGSYWIRAVPNVGDTSFTDSINLAILSYEGSDPSNMTDPTENVPISVLPLNETDLHPLVSTAVPGNATAGGADININITVGLNNGGTAFLVNGVSFDSPTVPVLLQILTGTPASELLPEGSIYPLGINQSVEIFFPNGAGGLNTGGPHPVHLHGHNFHVVRSAGATEYNYVDPVIRDVVSLGGTDDNVTIRFQTDNPGPWFMHCHIDWHLEKGFAVVMAEDVPDVSTAVTPPATWSALCPVYNIFANVTT